MIILIIMFIFSKILFSRPLDSWFLLPAVSSQQIENMFHICLKLELIADPVPGEPKHGTVSHLQSRRLIHYSVHTSCSQQSTKYLTQCVADEWAVISCTRSLNCSSGGGWCSEMLGSIPTSSVGLVTYQYTVSK